ncbi:MAG TPA: serine/threonine dehydratase [Pseudomonas sp.]|nr:serine/threonine dehydratase [Pseudomonas sp.]
MPASRTPQEPEVGDVSVADVLAAQARLRRFLPPTPLHYAERFGVWLKLENLQRTGSYKVRGALNALLAGRERGDDRPVICASAGNHAQGVAWAAYRLNIPAITVMPHGAPATKIAGVAHWGATVRQHGESYDEAYAFARALADQHGYRFLSAFDDPDVIAGQGTIGMELFEQAPDLDAVFVAVGGGGMIAGIGAALRTLAPGVDIIGCWPENDPALEQSLKAGKIVEVPASATLSDGTAGGVEPGAITLPLCKALLTDTVLVSEAQIRAAMRDIASSERWIIEGAAAVAVAAMKKCAHRYQGKRVAVVLCGRNIALDTFLEAVK